MGETARLGETRGREVTETRAHAGKMKGYAAKSTSSFMSSVSREYSIFASISYPVLTYSLNNGTA